MAVAEEEEEQCIQRRCLLIAPVRRFRPCSLLPLHAMRLTSHLQRIGRLLADQEAAPGGNEKSRLVRRHPFGLPCRLGCCLHGISLLPLQSDALDTLHRGDNGNVSR